MAIPGIGTFTVEQLPGRLDFLNKQLHSPIPVIRFNMDKTAQPDKSMYEFIMEDMGGISEIDAIKKFNDLTFFLQSELSKKGEATLPGVGKLQKEFGDTYSFQPEQSVQQYFPDTVAERVVRKDATHEVKVGEDIRNSNEMKTLLKDDDDDDDEKAPAADKWWLYAIILAIVALIALICYFRLH